MWKTLSYTAMAAMILFAWSASSAATAQKKAPARKSAAKKKRGTASTAKGTASRGKKAPAKRVTWRNRQMTPAPDRYREIQTALAAKGFLKPEDATGTWNQTSSDALKRFQSEQNLESTGKINSLSLIALGLGPRREQAPAPAAPPKPEPPVPGQ